MEQIAFLTDIHLDEQFPLDNNVNARQNLQRVLADLTARKITKIVIGGDIGEPTCHAWFFDTIKPFSCKLILGNHDNFIQVKQYYNQDLDPAELYYISEDDNYKWIFLDSSSDKVSKAQLQWLEAELITGKKVLIFIHHPLLPIDIAVDKLYPLQNREEVKEVILSSEKDVTVFCGHYHINDEQRYKNIQQLTTQAISFQMLKNTGELKIDNTVFGYRILSLDKGMIITELVTLSSSIR